MTAVALLVLLGLVAIPPTLASAATRSAATRSAATRSAATKSTSAKTRREPTAAQEKAITAFQKCLSSHGVKLPSHPAGGGSPGGSAGSSFPHGGFTGSPGSGSSAFSKAFAACGKLAPKGFGGGFGAGTGRAAGQFKPTAAQQAALSTYEQCMSSHGVQIAASSTFATISSLIKADPAAATANKQCQSDLQGAFRPSGDYRT